MKRRHPGTQPGFRSFEQVRSTLLDIRNTPDMRNKGLISILVDPDVPFGGRDNRIKYEDFREEEELEMYYGKEA
jgi:hypothetical protein